MMIFGIFLDGTILVDGITYHIKHQTTLVLFGVWRINNSENPLMEYIHNPPEPQLL